MAKRSTRHERIQASARAAETLDNVIIRENNAKAIEEHFDRAIATALEEIGLTAERYAKRETPVDTGRLRNSITHVIGTDSVYIGSNVEYAPAIEMGVHGRKGVNMLHNAATQHEATYRNILKKHLENG